MPWRVLDTARRICYIVHAGKICCTASLSQPVLRNVDHLTNKCASPSLRTKTKFMENPNALTPHKPQHLTSHLTTPLPLTLAHVVHAFRLLQNFFTKMLPWQEHCLPLSRDSLPPAPDPEYSNVLKPVSPPPKTQSTTLLILLLITLCTTASQCFASASCATPTTRSCVLRG